MIAIIKKEIKSYLYSPIGYIFIGSFLLMLSFLFYTEIYNKKAINFEYLFYDGATILTFIIPILTMRMFAEEKKNGTDELLFTAPVSTTAIAFGKFLSALLIVIVTEIFSLVYFFILNFFGDPSLQIALVTLLGFALLSMAYIACGMFISCITENQIIAGALSVLVFIAMWFLPGISKVFKPFSLISMFDKFPAGVINFEESVAFISFTCLFILLTIICLKRRKAK